jgi:hypothetical protein
MIEILNTLKTRNELLFFTGAVYAVMAFVCFVLIYLTNIQVLGISAFIKPMKFYISSVIYTFTMAWILHYLNDSKLVAAFSWTLVVTLTFENMYISYKAFIGQQSHFNISTSFNSAMFSLMAVAITIITLFTAYIAVVFFTKDFHALSNSYVWGIRLGLVLFVVFAFEGFVMGAKLSHTVGAPDGGEGLPVTNWSKQNGDLRIAHFLGMHALQILPLIGYYLTNNAKITISMGVLYFLLTTAILIQALNGKPLIKG